MQLIGNHSCKLHNFIISFTIFKLTVLPESFQHFYTTTEIFVAIIPSIPSKEQLVFLGDFKARVGADNDTWPSCLGLFGVGRMNENGQHLLDLCTYHKLCNAYFKTKPQHKASRRHPRSKHRDQRPCIHESDFDMKIANICLTICLHKINNKLA